MQGKSSDLEVATAEPGKIKKLEKKAGKERKKFDYGIG